MTMILRETCFYNHWDHEKDWRQPLKDNHADVFLQEQLFFPGNH